ncbi:hypothetical protein RCL1_008805 [Eukaryota sp. TZLM3-RCL]
MSLLSWDIPDEHERSHTPIPDSQSHHDSIKPFCSISQFSDPRIDNDVVTIASGGGLVVAVRNDGHLFTFDSSTSFSCRLNLSRDSTIKHAFVDPTGRHILVSAQSATNQLFYVYHPTRTEQTQKLKSLTFNTNTNLVTAVGWLFNEITFSTSPSHIILGTSQGNLYELNIEGSSSKCTPKDKLYSLECGTFVSGILIRCFDLSDTSCSIFVLITTVPRIYEFSTKSGAHSRLNPSFDKIFKEYFNTKPKFNELQNLEAPNCRSVLCVRYPCRHDEVLKPWSFCWMTSTGLFVAVANLTPQSQSESIITDSKLIPFPNHEVAVSAVLTDLHVICGYSDRIEIISLITQSSVFSIPVDFNPLSTIIIDGNCTRILGNRNILMLNFAEEDRDVWKWYTFKKDWRNALEFAKTQAQKDEIFELEGQNSFDQGDYSSAARRWARTNKPIEQVSLLFLEHSKDALLEFLIEKLAILTRNQTVDSQVQVSMIALWIVDVYLSRLSTFQSNERVLEDTKFEFRAFLDDNYELLHKQTTYNLISAHNRSEELIYFAKLIGDFHRVVDLLIQEGQYQEALDVVSSSRDANFVYKFSPILICHVPSSVIRMWRNLPSLDPKKLVPSLLLIQSNSSILTEASLFLESHVFSSNSDPIEPAVANLLLSYYAELEDDSRLTAMLSDERVSSTVDLQYALRVCASRGKYEASVRIHTVLGLYEEAVELALKTGDVELAKVNADRGGENDPDLKKKLWMKIAKFVISQSKSDVSQVLEFLSTASVLKIEDILPYLDSLTSIGPLKSELLTSLDQYAQEISELSLSMEKSTRAADLTRKSLRELKNRSLEVSDLDTCFICRKPALTKSFYVFPCSHTFHSDCLLTELSPLLSTAQKTNLASFKQDIATLERQIAELEVVSFPGEDVIDTINRTRVQKNSLTQKYDSIVASDCPLCGEFAIKQIDVPLKLSSDTMWNVEI